MAEPKRADARRNYDQLLAAARDAVAEHGVDASLRDVARRAEVGIGTLYRHFPSRDALLQAVFADRFDALCDKARAQVDAADPRAALTDWVTELAVGSGAYRGLPESVLAALRDEKSVLHASCEAMRAAGRDLLVRAQRADTVRADVTIEELLAVAAGIAWAGEHAPRPKEFTARLMSYVLAGI